MRGLSVTMRLADVLSLPVCQDVQFALQGPADLTRQITLAHVIDVPHAERWVGVQTLLLTTGLSWPRTASALRAFGNRLATRQPAAVMLAVPGPLRAFPPEVARALARAGIPALTLPYKVPFAAVVQAIHQGIVQEQAEVLSRSEAIHRALTLAALSGGLDDVIGTLSLHLGRPVALIGTEGERLLSSDAPHGTAPTPQALHRALRQPGTDHKVLPGGAGLLAPVLVHGERFGGLWIGAANREPDGQGQGLHGQSNHGRDNHGQEGHPGSDGARPSSPRRSPPGPVFSGVAQPDFTRPDLVRRSAEHACTVTALLLLARRDLETREAQLGSALIDTLLEGRFAADATSLARARTLGFRPEEVYTVGLLDLLEPSPLEQAGMLRRDRLTGEFRGALKVLGVPALLSPGAGHLWFLLPQPVTPERLWALLGPETQRRVGLVYSRPRPGAAGVAQGRAEVMGLVSHVAAGKVKGYGELLIPRAISGDRSAQHDLISALLEPLREVRGGAVLTETLRVLCSVGWAQERAAVQLGVHKNTLRYRMERAEHLTACSLSDPAIRAQWWLVFQIDGLDGARAANR